MSSHPHFSHTIHTDIQLTVKAASVEKKRKIYACYNWYVQVRIKSVVKQLYTICPFLFLTFSSPYKPTQLPEKYAIE
jgi:hypothetical protein